MHFGKRMNWVRNIIREKGSWFLATCLFERITLTDRLTDWPMSTDRPIDWLIDSLKGRLTNWLAAGVCILESRNLGPEHNVKKGYSFLATCLLEYCELSTGWLTDRPIHNWLTDWLIDWFVASLLNWLLIACFIYRMPWYTFPKVERAQKLVGHSVRQNLLQHLLSAAIGRASSSNQKNWRWPYNGAKCCVQPAGILRVFNTLALVKYFTVAAFDWMLRKDRKWERLRPASDQENHEETSNGKRIGRWDFKFQLFPVNVINFCDLLH